MIEDRNLQPGTRLVARYRGETYTAEVVQTEDGLRYRLADDGREFRSPSAAGSAVMGGQACNGWRFWSVEGTAWERKAKPEKRPRQPQAKAAPKAKGGKAKQGNGVAVNDGLNGFICETCSLSFLTSVEAVQHVQEAHPQAEAQAEG